MKQSPVVALTQVHQILDQIGSTLEVPLIMDQVAACMAEALDAQVVVIALTNPEGPPVVTASSGLARWQQAMIESTSTSPEWRFLQSGSLQPQVAVWPQVVPADFCQGHLEPLHTRGQLKGVLSLYWNAPYVLTAEVQAFLTCVAHLITTSVHHAELMIRSTLWHVELEAEVERRTVELRQAKLKLEQLDAMKRDFLSGVTHELRTPITTIKTLARLLQRRPDHAKTPDYLRVIEQECARQMGLVEDLIETAHLEVQPGPLFLTPLHLDEWVPHICAPHQTAAEAKGIAFRLTIEQGGVVPSHGRALSQILSNLLSNAVKFTPPGGQVDLQIRRSQNQLLLEVTDTGPGIAPSDLPHVFEEFYRGRTAPTAKGTGLGLTIVRQNVARLRGQVRVDSQLGTGCRITVVLPLEDPVVQDLVG